MHPQGSRSSSDFGRVWYVHVVAAAFSRQFPQSAGRASHAAATGHPPARHGWLEEPRLLNRMKREVKARLWWRPLMLRTAPYSWTALVWCACAAARVRRQRSASVFTRPSRGRTGGWGRPVTHCGTSVQNPLFAHLLCGQHKTRQPCDVRDGAAAWHTGMTRDDPQPYGTHSSRRSMPNRCRRQEMGEPSPGVLV